MPSNNQTTVPVVMGMSTFVVHLEDFPHGKYIRTSKGQFGAIDWFEVPDGVFVPAYDEQSQCVTWRPVRYWTVHRGCPVEIVTLMSGRQIFTDDDPRAVYGIDPQTFQFCRRRPSEARGLMVPRCRMLPTICDGSPQLESLPTAGWHNRARFQLKRDIPLDAATGYFMGCLVGDGWVPQAKTRNVRDICFAGITEEIASRLDEIVATFFVDDGPSRCTVASLESYGESSRGTYTSRPLAIFMNQVTDPGADYKRLPAFWARTSRDFREGLFAGLMDTDGSISVSRGKKKPQLMANYSSNSLRLVQEVQLLAMSLDIYGRITPSKTPAGKPCWLLSFSNQCLQPWGGKHMRHPEKLEKLHSVVVEETPVAMRYDLVPIPLGLAAAICQAIPTPKDHKLWPAGLSSVYSALSIARRRGYMTRATARRVPDYVPDNAIIREHEDWLRWWRIVVDTSVTWDVVKSVEKTEMVQTGYDLTVPGCETFMNAAGVILSNTAQYHIPTTDEDKQEAIDKMLPSKNLFSAATFKVHQLPSQEYVGGLYEASARIDKDKPPLVFATAADAIRAYKQGHIGVGRRVEILDK